MSVAPHDASSRLRVVVVGGGTAGWMTAAALARLLPARCSTHLVESEAIGSVGVGEATIPHIVAFNKRLGIDEARFMAATRATFKLGIEFLDWARWGDRYMHPFGGFGRDVGPVGFHHFWNRARQENLGAAGFGEYSMAVVMSRKGRFAPPVESDPGFASTYRYAYHFDATLYASFLRQYAEALGVRRTEGRILNVIRDSGSGDVRALKLENGAMVEGDLFIDCSGFRALLVDAEPFEDWSHWLPCDRAIALPSRTSGAIAPYTAAIAMNAGWRWRIPLQHRTGNGYVYSSAFLGDDAAAETLVSAVGESAPPPAQPPRLLRFTAGRRRNSWVGNCIAVGLASGFLEPLESTSIYLIQVAITALLELFPQGMNNTVEREEFNRVIALEYERIRDFLILHYHATERADTAFWDYVRTMPIPDSLAERIALFRARGRVETFARGLFLEPSWLAVLHGQRVLPEDYDPRARVTSAQRLQEALGRMRTQIAANAEAVPDHATYIAEHCAMTEAGQ